MKIGFMRWSSIIPISFLSLGLFLSPAFAQPLDLPTISVMNLSPGGGITSDEAVLLTDRLLVELSRTGRFQVTLRGARDSILLREIAFQHMATCDESKCLVEYGKHLGVRKMVGGSVGKLGKTYSVSLIMVDVETGGVDQTAMKDYPGNVDYLLTTAMKDVAWQLARGGLSLKEQQELKRQQVEQARIEAKKKKEEERKRQEEERLEAKRQKEEARLEAARKAEEERLAAQRAAAEAESLKVEAERQHVADSLAVIERAKAEELRRQAEARLAKEQEEKRKRDAELARIAEQKRQADQARKTEHARIVRRHMSFVSLALGFVAGAGAAYEWKTGGDALNKYNAAKDDPTITAYRKKVKDADQMTNVLIGVSSVCLGSSGVLFLSSRGGHSALSEANKPMLYLCLGKGGQPGAMLVMRFK